MNAVRPLCLLLSVGLVSACGRGDAETDQAAIDRGSYRSGVASEPGPARTTTTLPGGATVLATPAAVELQEYLNSGEPPGRAFELAAVSFVGGGEVREDPNGSIATIAAMIRNHPKAQIRIEVAHANPGVEQASHAAANRAARVAEVFVENGVPADRITSAGVNSPGASDEPQARLVVTRK